MAKTRLESAAYLAMALALAACGGTRNGKAVDPSSAAAIPPPAKMECMGEPAQLDSLLGAVRQALASDDKTPMREALVRAESHLAKMREKMAKCKAKMAGQTGEGEAKSPDGMMCCKKNPDHAPGDSGAGTGGGEGHSGHVH